MKTTDIRLRDPFVLVEDGKYHLYGTRSKTDFAKEAFGFDVYISSDLENWSEPKEIFHRPETFWSDHNYWAPEVHIWQGAYYMFATFAKDRQLMGTAILRAEKPDGPFTPWSDRMVTPSEWRCLDGTFHVSDAGEPYIVFSREWKQIHDGTIYALRLSDDLRHPIGHPVKLFSASQGRPAIRPFLFKNWVTDGPFLLRTEDRRLHMLWSSFGKGGYVQAMAHSDDNTLLGHWSVDQQLLFDRDGGHGMIFRTVEGQYTLTLHQPNRKLHEHPVFIPLRYENSCWMH